MICDSSASGSGQPARRGLSRKKAEGSSLAETAAKLPAHQGLPQCGANTDMPNRRFVVVNRRRFVAADERRRADAALAASAARVSLRRALQPVSFGAPLAARVLRAIASRLHASSARAGTR